MEEGKDELSVPRPPPRRLRPLCFARRSAEPAPARGLHHRPVATAYRDAAQLGANGCAQPARRGDLPGGGRVRSRQALLGEDGFIALILMAWERLSGATVTAFRR